MDQLAYPTVTDLPSTEFICQQALALGNCENPAWQPKQQVLISHRDTEFAEFGLSFCSRNSLLCALSAPPRSVLFSIDTTKIATEKFTHVRIQDDLTPFP